ncbi:MAG: phage baseplate protein, partial [Planctomycetota bacterium]
IRPDDNFTDIIEADASEAEDHLFSGDVSRLTVEDGSERADNITIRPIQVEADLRFSDVAYSKFNPVKSLESADGRGRKAALKLIGWHRSKRLLSLTTGLAAYSNIAIRQITAPRTSADGRSVLCRVVFVELPVNIRSGAGIQGATKSVITAVEHTAFGLIRLGDLS